MTPQATLGEFGTDELAPLTEAETDAWTAVEEGEKGVREYARETDRSPGTVGNLLARARQKVGREG